MEREDKHIANILDRHPFLQDLNEVNIHAQLPCITHIYMYMSVCAKCMHAGAFSDTFTQFSAEVERMLGTEKESKFAEMAPSIVKYGMDSVDTASVRMVYEQWNKDLKGKQECMHAWVLVKRPLTT